jgi:hypothetical protein
LCPKECSSGAEDNKPNQAIAAKFPLPAKREFFRP